MTFWDALGYLNTIRKLRKQLQEKEDEIKLLRKDNQAMYEQVKSTDQRLMEVL